MICFTKMSLLIFESSAMINIQSSTKLSRGILLTFRKINTPYLILLAILFNLILSLSFALITHKSGYSINANFMPFDSIKEELLVVVLFAPFAETVIYQYWLVDVTLFITQRLLRKESLILALLIPSICFALSHMYNYIYVANTFIAGLSINLFYIIVKLRKQNAFISTVIMHALYNLGVFTLKHI